MWIYATMYRMALRWAVVMLCLSITFGAVLAKTDEKKSRVLDKPLSGQDHFDDDVHNPDYDHEAFLGEEDARTFDSLSPEESQEKLGDIVDKIDTDNDKLVSQQELKDWIDLTQKKYIIEDVKRQWSSHNPKNNEKLSWDEYKTMVYGFLDNIDQKEIDSDEDNMSYSEMLKRDERRWELADADQNGGLTFEEFTDFLHPEEAHHMRDIVLKETMEDIDKDGDGKLSLQEYIGDMYNGEDGDGEPAWVSNEREQFEQFRDKDKSGYLELDEVRSWIIPEDYDHSNTEAKHLISEADSDKDGFLTKDEVLDNYDLFVGSQATDFGEALGAHDEF